MDPGLSLILLVLGLIAIGAAVFLFRKQNKTVVEIPAAVKPVVKPAPEEVYGLDQALQATKKNLWGRIKESIVGEQGSQALDQVEEVLYTSDLGPRTVESLMSTLHDELSSGDKNQLEKIHQVLRTQFQNIFDEAGIPAPGAQPFTHLNMQSKPAVWMVVGVNGAGKTTSIGKLAAQLAQAGKKVLVAAGDTFRAAAGSQLEEWSKRARVEIFSPAGVTDPSAVAYQALEKGKDFDVVLIDTAGRLHTQSNLMEELKKTKRVMAKVVPDAPHETLLVLDANNGQNALIQAQEFHNALNVSGVILTKMDGTAKGGVAIGLASQLKIPIRMIGVGERLGDLRAFSSHEFIDSIL